MSANHWVIYIHAALIFLHTIAIAWHIKRTILMESWVLGEYHSERLEAAEAMAAKIREDRMKELISKALPYLGDQDEKGHEKRQ
jgi:hypothetical protein